MKKSIVKGTIVSFVFFSVAFVSHAGREVGNGGNGIVAEFYSIYDSLLKIDHQLCYSTVNDNGVFPALHLLRTELEVQTSKHPLHGKKGIVGALNFPDMKPRLLVLSEGHWINLNEEQKTRLALHELLYLVGVDEDRYLYSGPLMNCIKKSEQPIKSWVQTWEILIGCEKDSIQSLTTTDFKIIRTSEFDVHRNLTRYFIDAMCVEALQRFKTESIFKCDEFSFSRLCEMTSEMPKLDPQEPAFQKKVQFLGQFVSEFDQDVDLRTCSWEICQLPGPSLPEKIQKFCQSKLNQ